MKQRLGNVKAQAIDKFHAGTIERKARAEKQRRKHVCEQLQDQ